MLGTSGSIDGGLGKPKSSTMSRRELPEPPKQPPHMPPPDYNETMAMREKVIQFLKKFPPKYIVREKENKKYI